jgi:hypothetical protein
VPSPGSTIFDPEAQTRRELAEAGPLAFEADGRGVPGLGCDSTRIIGV